MSLKEISCFCSVFDSLFQWNLKIDQGKFKSVSKVFQGWFEKFYRPFKPVSRDFQEGIKDVSRICSRCFKEVLCCMTLIAAIRAKEELFSMYFQVVLLNECLYSYWPSFIEWKTGRHERKPKPLSRLAYKEKVHSPTNIWM